MESIDLVVELRRQASTTNTHSRTHAAGCWQWHIECLMSCAAIVIENLQSENEKLWDESNVRQN